MSEEFSFIGPPLTGSKDTVKAIVFGGQIPQLHPVSERTRQFGHLSLFNCNMAQM